MHSHFPNPGRVEWIGLTPKKAAPLVEVASVLARPGFGLEGDRHSARGRLANKRQVTLIQAEHFAVIEGLLGRPVDPGMTRRNVVVRGIPLFALRFARFRVGSVLLEGTGVCAPCQRMEASLGHGGFNAMRGHGGICARVLEEGTLSVGDPVVFVSGDPPKGDE